MKISRNQDIPLSFIFEETIGDFSLDNKKYFLHGFVRVTVLVITLGTIKLFIS